MTKNAIYILLKKTSIPETFVSGVADEFYKNWGLGPNEFYCPLNEEAGEEEGVEELLPSIWGFNDEL